MLLYNRGELVEMVETVLGRKVCGRLLSGELMTNVCYTVETMKYLSAKQKADELGITTNGLAKTRHLYKHIKKAVLQL